ncbi:MAG: hypothetical protein M1826_002974 [Phylliscum demangeonii]|nr:MAG: hypothetical protein M1826_002974 [Phylliscum demangeonii]
MKTNDLSFFTGLKTSISLASMYLDVFVHDANHPICIAGSDLPADRTLDTIQLADTPTCKKSGPARSQQNYGSRPSAGPQGSPSLRCSERDGCTDPSRGLVDVDDPIESVPIYKNGTRCGRHLSRAQIAHLFRSSAKLQRLVSDCQEWGVGVSDHGPDNSRLEGASVCRPRKWRGMRPGKHLLPAAIDQVLGCQEIGLRAISMPAATRRRREQSLQEARHGGREDFFNLSITGMVHRGLLSTPRLPTRATSVGIAASRPHQPRTAPEQATFPITLQAARHLVDGGDMPWAEGSLLPPLISESTHEAATAVMASMRWMGTAVPGPRLKSCGCASV